MSLDPNPYSSPARFSEAPPRGDSPSDFWRLPFWCAVLLFVVPTLISGTLLICTYAVGIEAGVGNEGRDTPGWAFVDWIPLVDLPAYIVVGILSGTFLPHPGDAFCDLDDIHRTFVLGRILWPLIGFAMGLIYNKIQRSSGRRA